MCLYVCKCIRRMSFKCMEIYSAASVCLYVYKYIRHMHIKCIENNLCCLCAYVRKCIRRVYIQWMENVLCCLCLHVCKRIRRIYIKCLVCVLIWGEVGGWGRVPFSRNVMSPTPCRKWYLTTGRRAHYMVLDPIPQSLPVHFFGSRPQTPPSRYECKCICCSSVSVCAQIY